MTEMKKYADVVMGWLKEEGYTHCFFVAGGNSMHLLDGARQFMHCVPFVHEVSAGIAAEYFNEVQNYRRAFVLVTAGPGLTNLLTAMAGAYLESRELLVLGGQVKSSDLASAGLRQRGIQEVDGVGLASPISKSALRITEPISRAEFMSPVRDGRTGRKGPVFLEICLDAQALPFEDDGLPAVLKWDHPPTLNPESVQLIRQWLSTAERPLLLVGGGIERHLMPELLTLIEDAGLPVVTTWNGADRIGSEHPLYFGRPNTWGQRSSNVIIQQSDLIIAAGTRLGLQQTGFNWQQFGPKARIVQIDVDRAEVEKGHPSIAMGLVADALVVLRDVLMGLELEIAPWVNFCRQVREVLPTDEATNSEHHGFVNPYKFARKLSTLCTTEDIVIPCSSGGAFTVMMQAFENKTGQLMVTNKGLASMGYGLAGAIGASLGQPDKRTVLVEGDGGFSQNLQELATVSVNCLPLKIFVFSNEGYASIRMTQRNYFGGQYLGCDIDTGLGFPDWRFLAQAYGLQHYEITSLSDFGSRFGSLWESPDPVMFTVRVHPEQTYYPKITSRITASGGMESAPLHLMSPELDVSIAGEVLRYI